MINRSRTYYKVLCYVLRVCWLYLGNSSQTLRCDMVCIYINKTDKVIIRDFSCLLFSNKTERLRRVSFYSLESVFLGLGKHVDVSLLLDCF